MRKTIILLTFAAFIGIGSYLVFAQDPMGGGMMGGGMGGGMMNNSERGQQSSGQEDMRGGMRGRSMMGTGMMMNDMGSMMNGSSLVATSDGGVVVLMGNELSKYDKDLNLVKQVEVKFNWDNWQKMMMQRRNMMMQNRDMMMGGRSRQE